MTDSMKFGPEWLRNMSADTTCSNNTSGQITNSASTVSSGTACNRCDESSASNANSIFSSISTNSLQNNATSTNSGVSRNTFPEFRYGREEMLLLFDRNCGLPEILPSYKNLFVERVQFPLALVPSTDEEIMHGSAQPTSDRSWVERNGVVTNDPAMAGSSILGGGGTSSTDAWNGNTPVSSPRREFSNHPRNMENWRRSRNEDVSGGDIASPATFSTETGWRINSSGFQNSHNRWGRSNSWRDDDAENSENGSAVVGSGGIMMLRSNSSISTIHSARIGETGVCGKQAVEVGVMRSLSIEPSGNRNSTSGNIWPSKAAPCAISNMQSDGIANDEMALPEWAMESPSDVGGTFDASGAFHGSVDDNGNSEKPQGNYTFQQTQIKRKLSSKRSSKFSDDGSMNSVLSQRSSSLKQSGNYQIATSPSPTPPTTVIASHDSTDLSEEIENQKYFRNNTCNVAAPTNLVARDNGSKKRSETDSSNDYCKESETNYINNVQNKPTTANNAENVSNNIADYAERMMKVTDDMIEKLIMDDEDAKDGHNLKSSLKCTGNKISAHNLFIAMQQSQSLNHPALVTSALGAGGGALAAPPNGGLYNIGGMMVDHTHNVAALHHLQQQQMAAVAAVAIGLQTTSATPHPMTSTSPTDLWLYRDPQAKVQGPFSALEMTEWYRAGYFNENLFVRRVCDARFRPLGELIKICNDQMPFSNSHLIPIDMNVTTITPPLPPVISVQQSAQSTDFLVTSLNEHQQHEKLKGNVTAAADSLSNALKTLINSVDIAQVLNVHFQTLQDRFIHNQEIEIASELSKNECFQRLSPAEKDVIVRQKLQTLGLPEYLTNLTGLSNSLAALNPTAGTQLYDTIAECTKKEQLFSNHQSQQQSKPLAPPRTSEQKQKANIHDSSPSTSYMDAEDFIMKSKKSSSDMNSTELLNEFNLRMFLNNGSDSGTGNTTAAANSHSHQFLNDQQLFGSAMNHTPNPANNAAQSQMMQMWMNSLVTKPSNHVPSQQNLLLPNVPQANSVNNQWLNVPLVGISSMSLSTEQQGSPKATPSSMWDVATLEQHVQQQQQQQHLGQHVQQQTQQQTLEVQRQLKDTEKHFADHRQKHPDINKSINKQENKRETEQQQKLVNELQKSHDVAKVFSTNDDHYKQEQQLQTESEPLFLNDKSNAQVNNKRDSINNNSSKQTNKYKNGNLMDHISKKIEEERRREQNEEKRRHKEDRKRQQLEEEKRRLLQAEEEKRRQIQDEEKRQHLIQAQRRKALMNNNASNSTNNIASSTNLKSKEQHCILSSVAPWSTQATKSQGPGLAEIQKAERRERRADQQRQLEIHEKQMRAIAATEAQDAIVKWNASPLLVKSFAEIQAEEAKRLAYEQLELQKRKDQDAHNSLVAFSSASNTSTGAFNSSSTLASIWTGNKLWGTSGNTSGFWDESLKFKPQSLNTESSNTNTTINDNHSNTSLITASVVFQPSKLLQKPPTAAQQQHILTIQPSSNKNIKKIQNIAVMQNTIIPSSAGTSTISSNQKKNFSNATLIGKQTKLQKGDKTNAGTAGAGSIENKKMAIKSNNSVNKGDDYEAEFIYWCTKTLNNMNAKVDVPTFVLFLRDLESPYEVKDYIRVYLGESKEYTDFAKQFLERRSKYKNLQRAQNAHDDDLCKPAQAITPSVNDNSDNKGKQKKVKKSKMTKLDARILGFSVTAAEGRINVGDRDYVDAP